MYRGSKQAVTPRAPCPIFKDEQEQADEIEVVLQEKVENLYARNRSFIFALNSGDSVAREAR